MVVAFLDAGADGGIDERGRGKEMAPVVAAAVAGSASNRGPARTAGLRDWRVAVGHIAHALVSIG
jgi:hypothetical protein